MREEYCEACETLKEDAYTFATNGVTTGVANRLKQDNGFASPSTVDTDCEALNIGNDCLIGGQEDTLENYDVCDIKVWLKESWANLHTMLKAMIAAICGIWTKIHCILSGLHTLLSQLTKSDSFAAKTSYAFSSGAGGAPYSYMGWNQRIIPTSGSGTQCDTEFLDVSLSPTEQTPSTIHDMPTANTNTIKIVGRGNEIVFPSDGVAICGCCGVGTSWRGRNSMQVVFYTTNDLPDETPLYYDSNGNVSPTPGVRTLLNTRGLHYGDYIGNNDSTRYGSMSNPMTTAIKVKAGSKLRIFVRSAAIYTGDEGVDDIPLNNDMSGSPEYGDKWWSYYGGSYNNNGVETEGVVRPNDGPNTYARFGVHQIWCTFVPDFTSALNIDPTIFDGCGE